jgi:glycosyltransferase involved in cell wall biosynthesis
MAEMRILHFCGSLKGGPLTALAEWTSHQLATGHTVGLVYSPARDPVGSFKDTLPPQVQLISLDVHREIDPVSDFAATRKLTRLLRQMRPDVLHLHSSKAGAIGRVAARLAGVPAIYSTHSISYLRTDVSVAMRVIFYAMEWLLGFVGTVSVACSPSELQAMRFIPGRKIVIPNGIDLDALPQPAVTPPHQGLDIVLCGRITVQKNPRLACAIAAASPPEWRWTWLGSGEMEDVVREGGRIAVAGWLPRPDVLARLGAADVIVHTSSWEGMPIAMLEAMALGRPVVATDVVGNRDLVEPGKTGFVARDVAGVLRALCTLEKSPSLRQAMGEAARARVATDYNQTRLAARWMQLYESLRRH